MQFTGILEDKTTSSKAILFFQLLAFFSTLTSLGSEDNDFPLSRNVLRSLTLSSWIVLRLGSTGSPSFKALFKYSPASFSSPTLKPFQSAFFHLS
jgi:hypothetical protein